MTTPDIPTDLDGKFDWIAAEASRLGKHMERLAAISRLCSFAHEQAQDLSRAVTLHVLYVSREEFDNLEGEASQVGGDQPSWAKDVVLCEAEYIRETDEFRRDIRLSVHCHEPPRPSPYQDVKGTVSDDVHWLHEQSKATPRLSDNWVREDKQQADAREAYLDGIETMREDWA